MTSAVRDLILRMTGGDEPIANSCVDLLRELADGHICAPIAPADCDRMAAVPGLLANLGDTDPEPGEVRALFVARRGLLYTRRNWLYERKLRHYLRALPSAQPFDATASLPDTPFYRALRPEQRTAVLTLAANRFTILTGGPGTGKTHTLARAVAWIREHEPTLRLGLAAPTGKAAARMAEAMTSALQGGGAPRATTLHALLGGTANGVTFRHNRDNPLPLDWLIVDEASMIDLPLMAKLLDALPEGCRLTLVGDVDQLASVERGRVLGDLCRLPGISLCRLCQSTRFPAGGEIATLAEAVNTGHPEAALALLATPTELLNYHDLTGLSPFHPAQWPGFLDRLRQGFAAFAAARTPEEALAHLNDCRLLCALRHGPYGYEQLNETVKTLLGVTAPLPLMITQNDHALGVANGDVGVVMPAEPDRLYLPSTTGPRAIRRAFLPATEMAYATTVHKSQGSEFTDVFILLPPTGDSPLLTREILYTAITRTKRAVHLYAGEPAIRRCCLKRIERLSGLDA
ncbi:MAG: exodeoxyribonuclease V subunit alpha [Candidatus Spyradenecus sp.]